MYLDRLHYRQEEYFKYSFDFYRESEMGPCNRYILKYTLAVLMITITEARVTSGKA